MNPIAAPVAHAARWKQIEKARKTFELLMDSGEAEGRRDWMREHWKTVEADV